MPGERAGVQGEARFFVQPGFSSDVRYYAVYDREDEDPDRAVMSGTWGQCAAVANALNGLGVPGAPSEGEAERAAQAMYAEHCKTEGGEPWSEIGDFPRGYWRGMAAVALVASRPPPRAGEATGAAEQMSALDAMRVAAVAEFVKFIEDRRWHSFPVSLREFKQLAHEHAASLPAAPAAPNEEERIYPCDFCPTMRTKAEGGTTFTVCDPCWDKHVVGRRDGSGA